MDEQIDDKVQKDDKLDDFLDDYSLLIECGFIGAKQLDEINATRIFNACMIIDPTNLAAKMGLGHIALNKMDIKNATRIFDEIVTEDPDHNLARCFLGMCYLMTKDKLKKGEKIIQEAIERSSDPTVKNLGLVSLEWAEKDLSKRAKAPYEPKE